MRRAVRRVVVVAVVAATVGAGGPAVAAAAPVGAAGAVVARPAPPPGPQTPEQVRALALPPYEQWLREVRAVTDQASGYLAGRLPDGSRRTAIVLDIDNTALQTSYRPGVTSPATPGVIELARQADAAGAAVFFVTARPEILRLQTQLNLNQAGYPRDGLFMRPWFDTRSNEALKTAARATIEGRGYTIVANVGNSPSDLAGGRSERTFKLPDYDGQLS